MSLPESTDSVAFLPPSSKGAWSERRFALTMLGIVAGLACVMQICARIIWSYYDPLTPPGPELICILGYTIALPTLAAFYVCWGQTPLFIRTAAGLAAVAFASRVLLAATSEGIRMIYDPRVLVFFAMLLMWTVVLRLTKLRLIRPWPSQHSADNSRRGQFRLNHLLSWTFSISLVFAFIRTVPSVHWNEEFTPIFTVATRFLICLPLILAGVSVLMFNWSLYFFPLVAALCVASFLPVWLSNERYWMEISRDLGIPLFACLFVMLGLLPFRFAGYRLAWKVPASLPKATDPLAS